MLWEANFTEHQSTVQYSDAPATAPLSPPQFLLCLLHCLSPQLDCHLKIFARLLSVLRDAGPSVWWCAHAGMGNGDRFMHLQKTCTTNYCTMQLHTIQHTYSKEIIAIFLIQYSKLQCARRRRRRAPIQAGERDRGFVACKKQSKQ